MDIPRTLAERLHAGKVVPFIGAGVSMAVRDKETHAPLFPSWKQLLERAAQRLEEERKGSYVQLVRSLLAIEQPDYLDAARRAREGLGAVWVEFLKEQLDRPRERADDESLNLARAVWQLGSQLLITTNYDRVLHWACPQPSDCRSWDIEAPAEQVQALRTGVQHPTIWYLHGCIDNAADLILTPDGYSHLYPKAENIKNCYEAALTILRSLLTSHSFLFIGFSLDDAYFGLQLRGVHEIFRGVPGPHYALVRASDRERVRALDVPVEVVTFEDFGAPLLDLVHALSELASRAEAGERTPVSPLRPNTPASPASHVVPYDPRNRVFFVPYRPKGDQVIGREDSLLRVREQLTHGRRTAIGQAAAFQGLGGLGKTQLAVEYAYRYRDSYPQGVIWLNADQDLDAQLIKISDEARWIAPESEHKDKLAVAQRRLRTSSNCLIVFDNLEDLGAIVDYLPEPQTEPHILVTSRTEQPGFTPIPLDLLGEDLSMQLLLQEAGREPVGEAEWQAARAVASILGGLPLALELAGAYLRHRPVDWQQYHDFLQQNLKAALQSRFLKASFTQHETDLYSTLKIQERVFEEEPMLREILDLLTWSGPAPMGQDLLCALLDVAHSTELTNALGLGLALRLLQKTPHDERYAIHRLVREVRREDVPLAERQNWAYDICRRLGNWFQERRKNFADLPNFEAEIDHLRAWQEYAVEHALQYASRLAWLQGYPSLHRRRGHEAKEWVEKALIFFEQMEKKDRELEAHLANDHGLVSDNFGDDPRALSDHTKALTIRQELFGEHHPDTAISLNNVGTAYIKLGNPQRALEYHEKALAIQQELFGERHPDTVIFLGNIGSTYGALGDHHHALAYQEKALVLGQELFGERHPHTATSLNNVGLTYGELGDPHRALEYQEKALAIRRELFGERHPDTATSLNNVGLTYGELGDPHRALEYHEKALAIQQELFGERHPDTAISLNNIGSTYGKLGNPHRALEYHEKALAIQQELFGERHPNTATALHNVGITYGKLGDRQQGLKYQEKGLAILREFFGDLHPVTVLCVDHVAHSLTNVGRRPEAFQLLEAFLLKLPKDHIHYIRLNRRKQQLLRSGPLRPGFRQPPRNPQSQRRKKKK